MAENAKAAERAPVKIVAQNRKARHDYHIEETLEAGLVLTGTEVKSLRGGRGSLQESFAEIRGGEAWIVQFHIPHYEQGNIFNVDPVRRRKLLLHSHQIEQLSEAISRKGYTLVPLQVHFKNGRAKLLVGLARGKKSEDKRAALKERDVKREMDRALRSSRRGE